jgi:hypothetical protein
MINYLFYADQQEFYIPIINIKIPALGRDFKLNTTGKKSVLNIKTLHSQ